MDVYVISLVVQGFFFVSVTLATEQILDFCVSDPKGQVLVSGMTCKESNQVRAEDFFYAGLHNAGEITSAAGTKVTAVTSAQVPGLNALGISMARIDFAPWGINPPHTHPRAAEVLAVLNGTIEAGFVTASPANRLITKTLEKGDVFVFPAGLIHYQRNVGSSSAWALAAFGSQNPGVVDIAQAVFGSAPDISSEILVKAFQVDDTVIGFLKSKFYTS